MAVRTSAASPVWALTTTLIDMKFALQYTNSVSITASNIFIRVVVQQILIAGLP